MRRVRRVALVCLFCLTPAAALAGGPAFDVAVDATCPELRGDELARHLPAAARLDPEAVEAAGRWVVRVSCSEATVELEVTGDDGTRAARSLPIPRADDPDRERIVALAVLPLLPLTSLDPPAPEPEPEPEPEPQPDPEPEPEADPDPEPEPEPEPEAARVGLTIAVAPALGTRAGVSFVGGGALRGTVWPLPRLGVWLDIGLLYGVAPFADGEVVLVDVPAGLGVSGRVVDRRAWGVEVDFGVALRPQRLEGRSEVRPVGRVFAVAGGPELGLRLPVRLGEAWVLGPGVRAGWQFGGPRGEVTGDEALEASGPWLLGEVRLRFGRRSR